MDDKLDEVRKLMEQLKCMAKDTRDEVRNEELQARKKIKSEVSLWLDQVSSIEKEVECIEAEVEKVGLKDFLVKLKGLVSRIGALIKKAEFPRGVVLDKPTPPPLVTEKMEGSTPSKVQDQVWSCFEGGETRVGVYGMGGVGKTTMAMHINNKCLKPNPLFDTVYYVTVSRDTSVSKLQHDAANALGIRFDYEDEPKRAAELSAALQRRQNCLLILDDVWDNISMVKVGLSAEGGGCKLLITTRKLDVVRKMDCVPVNLEPLSKNESWDLFMKKLGDYEALSEEAKHTARLVAKKCGRLPLAIITVAGAMRGERSEQVWRDALRTLKCIETSSQIEMEEEVFSILRFSYDRLKDDVHRTCFLHCALYPEDHKIDWRELISLIIAVGLVDGGSNRRENIDKGHTMLNHLVNASLVEYTYSAGVHYIKMHDLVRDMALKEIGARGMVKAGNSLGEVPPETEWNNQDLELVSLMHNHIRDIEGMNSPHCPKVSVLLLQRNPRLSYIPSSFFAQMIGLKFLNLSCTDIEVLPDSVSGLVNLNSLWLWGCECLRFIPSLAKLTSLREINIEFARKMEKFPDGMEELVSLEHLDLNYSGIKGFHSGTLRRLGNLQVLLGNHRLIVSVEELMSLRHLERLDGCHIDDVCQFNQCVEVGCFGSNQHPCLIEYFVSVGFWTDGDTKDAHFYIHHKKRGICVSRFSWSIGTGCGLLLPCSVEVIQFRACNFGGRSLLDAVPSLCHVTELEFCELRSCEGVEYIIPLPDEWPNPSFPKGIHYLCVSEMNDFRGLIRRRGVRDHGYNISFSGLRTLVIEGCPNMERLWLTNLDLPNLEELEIRGCEKMEEIFATAKGEPIKLPKLLKLDLVDLPELRSVWCDNDVLFQGIQEQQLIHLNEPGGLIRRGGVRDHGSNISFGALRTIDIDGCPKLERLWLLNVELPNLEDIFIDRCARMKEIFTTLKGEMITLPKLLNLILVSLPELRSVCCDKDVSFPNLLKIVLNYCGEVRELGITSLNMPSLERIKIEDCPKMKEIFATAKGETITLPKLLNLELKDLPELRSVWCDNDVSFPNLAKILLLNCGEVRELEFTSFNMPSLERIEIKNCPKMKDIFTTEKGESITLLKLRKLKLEDLPELRSVWCDNDVSFPNLLKIVLHNCREVRELGFTSFKMPSLERIEIKNCPKMKEIFTAQDEIGDDTTVEMPNMKDIVVRLEDEGLEDESEWSM